MKRRFLVLGILSALGGTALAQLSPEESLKTFHLEAGLRLEVVAAEPLVIDPVAVCFDEAGRMYVAENRGYPLGPVEGDAPAGVIARLEDKDGDGRYETRTDFATGLTFPNGLLPWRGGLFVTCSPDIFYLKDTDGDGVADFRRVVLTGFSTKSTTQLRVAHPKLGLDGNVWITAGLQGGEVHSPVHPDRPGVSFAKSDSRFNPDTYQFETVSGQAQFGLSFDDWGNKFISANRNPIWHAVVPTSDYWKRNPRLAFSDTVQIVGTAGEQARVFPLSKDTTTAGYMPRLLSAPHMGTFTSACGVLIFRGDALTPDHQGNAFICEPAQNLVQRRTLTPLGATFDARVAIDGQDFLATPDSWSRIVYADQGPDGGLYLCDFYRKTLDHPQYLPEEVRAKADFVSGRELGRIYRVVREDFQRPAKVDFAGASARDLVTLLGHPNGWVRDTARRLVLEQGGPQIVRSLRYVAINGKDELAIVNSLHSLQVLGQLPAGILGVRMEAGSPRVREAAVKLAEPQLAREPALARRLIGLAADPDGKVRFQTALALGATMEEDKIPALASIAISGAADRWTRAAVLSSIGDGAESFTRELIARAGDSPEFAELMQEVCRVDGASLSPDSLRSLLLEITREGARSWAEAALTGIAEGLPAQRTSLEKLLGADSPASREVARSVTGMLDRAQAVTRDARQPEPARLAAIELLGHAGGESADPVLLDLVGSRDSVAVQSAAIRALGRLQHPGVGGQLVGAKKWRGYSPAISQAVVGTMLSQTSLTRDLLRAIDEGVVQVWVVDPNRRTQLMKHRDPEIKALATQIFGGLESGDRMKAYEEAKAVLQLPAKPANGKAVFARVCSQCHVLDGVGKQVGPDLSGVRNQPAEALLLHIIVPNYEVVPGFTSYEVETTNDRLLSGLLASESDTSVTIRQAQGVEETILRANIASMRSTSLSLMPQQLEQTMTPQELADLIAYLKAE